MDDRVKQSYLRYHRKRAKLLAVGIALVVSSLGIANLFMLLPVIPTQDASVLAEVLDKIIRVESHEFVDFSFSDKHVLAPFSFVVMIAIKRIQLKAKSINQVIVVIGAVATLALYFLPTLYTPFFWVPIAAAFDRPCSPPKCSLSHHVM